MIYIHNISHLFRTQLVRGCHKMRADERKCHTVAVLCRELHALTELLLKRRCVEAAHRTKHHGMRTRYTTFPLEIVGG